MTALFFVCLTGCIFASIVLSEAQSPGSHLRFGSGLLGWLASGNWPAKVGGGLVIIGLGALMRYALLNIDVAPEVKLGSGVAASMLLFGSAHIARVRLKRREIFLALAGAAFGVAYLTAYSAYAFFHYVESFPGLVLLAVTAVGAGAYAIFRDSVSIAVLALFGAFLAPAFALDHPSAIEVYGYYIAISQLTLLMIAARGWRPLIHLSFLFTLGGGLFFAWTHGFYAPAYFNIMQPMLLALTAIHLVMPVAETRAPASRWSRRFDLGYFLILPATSALSLATVAPSAGAQSTSLLIMGAMWVAAAVVTRVFKTDGTARHAFMGTLLGAFAMFLRLPHLPWFLICEFGAVLALIVANRQQWTRAQQDLTLFATLLSGVLFVAATLNDSMHGTPFVNQIALERIAAALLFISAGAMAGKLNHPLSPFMLWTGSLGLIDVAATELYRLHIASWPMILHAVALVAAVAVCAVSSRRSLSKSWSSLATVGIVVSAWPALSDADYSSALLFLALAPLALLMLAFRSTAHEQDYDNSDRIATALALPLVACVWADRLAQYLPIERAQFALSIAAVCMLIVIALSRLTKARDQEWPRFAVQTYAVFFGAVLVFFTTACIQRGVWPAALELLCACGLIQLSVLARHDERRSLPLHVASTIGTALVIQAMLVRALGPDRTLTLLDVFDLKWPALLSFFWSSLGAALTILARRIHSRSLWSAGAVVLVACAVKLMLLDFGSLGQLANILALIAAGLVFLLVSRLAPPPGKDACDETIAETAQ